MYLNLFPFARATTHAQPAKQAGRHTAMAGPIYMDAACVYSSVLQRAAAAAASEREQLLDIKEDKVSGPSNVASPSLTIISDLCGSYH